MFKEHYKARSGEKIAISISFKSREYSISATLGDISLCFEAATLEFDQTRIAQIASRVSFYGDEADGDDMWIFEQMEQAVRNAAFGCAKEAAAGAYNELKPYHQQLNHFHRKATPEFPEDDMKNITMDNPADLQVLYLYMSEMEQDVAQAWIDEVEIAEAEKVKALALQASTPLIRAVGHHRMLPRGFVHKDKSSDDDPDSQESDQYELLPPVILSSINVKQSNSLCINRSCCVSEGRRAA